jgi:hypothetical protein
VTTTPRTSLALLIAGGLAAATLPVAVASATATTAAVAAPTTSAVTYAAAAKKKSPVISLSDRTLRTGDRVTVKGKRYPKAGALLFIAICATPVGEGTCDHSPDHLKQKTKKAGKTRFTTKFKVKATKFRAGSGTVNCKKRQCVIGTINAYAMTDHSFQATKKFTVG